MLGVGVGGGGWKGGKNVSAIWYPGEEQLPGVLQVREEQTQTACWGL